MIGRSLKHYEIIGKLGSGGMGDVYLAQDTKLDRKVALKVLPPDLAEDEERRSRFTREAKVVAGLNHPNIVTLYSVEEADDVHFITMELVSGKTLAELLPRNGFELDKLMEFAGPLANAVAAAHERGVIHRDLKPSNLMLTDSGELRVLDFGLAKLERGVSSGTDVSDATTQAKTGDGVILGTAHYMSPEQAAGRPIDHRSDIFSIGVVLYELATGQRPFQGDTPLSILSSILRDEPPPVRDLKPSLPYLLERTIRRCLAKEPARRFQTAIDIRNEIEELQRELSSGKLVDGASPAAHSHSIARYPLFAICVVVSTAVAGLIGYYFSRPSFDAVPRMSNPVQITSAVGSEDFPTWSPDGGRLAFESDQSGNKDLWVTQLGGGEPINLTAAHSGDDRWPSWSPDGRQIAFGSSRDGGGIFVMSAVGGQPRKLLTLPSDSHTLTGAPQWLTNGTEIAVAAYERSQGFLHIASVETREARRIQLPNHGGNQCLRVSWSADGRFIAYVEAPTEVADITRLWVAPLLEQSRRR